LATFAVPTISCTRPPPPRPLLILSDVKHPPMADYPGTVLSLPIRSNTLGSMWEYNQGQHQGASPHNLEPSSAACFGLFTPRPRLRWARRTQPGMGLDSPVASAQEPHHPWLISYISEINLKK